MKVAVKVKTDDAKKCPAMLTKIDVQEAVCAAIIEAEERRIEIGKTKTRNTKLSIGTILVMVTLGLIGFISFFMALVLFCDRDMIVGYKLLIFALGLVFFTIVTYLSAKHKEHNYLVNLLSALIAFGGLWLTMLSLGD